MTTTPFSDFVLPGSTIQVIHLKELCDRFYALILQGHVSEVLFQDFCDCLQRKDFFDAVKSDFPVLRGLDDEFESDETAEYVERMKDAVKVHLPEPYLPPAAHNEAILGARHLLTTLAHLVFTKRGIEESLRTSLFKSFAALFEAAGGAIPDYIDNYLDGQGGSLEVTRRGVQRLPRSERAAYQGAAEQPRNTFTETGVYNGGNTCYQNVVYRLMLSSNAVTSNLSRPNIADLFDRTGDDDAKIGFHLFKLLRAIEEVDFETSKVSLRNVWAALKAKDPKWARGIQQDAHELIHDFEGAFLKYILVPSWEHHVQSQFECLSCHKQAQSALDPSLIYNLPLPSAYSDGRSDEFAEMLRDSLTRPVTISKDCQCGTNRYHTKLDPIVQQAGKTPELVIALLRFKSVETVQKKLKEKVTLPSAFFTVPGCSTLYFLKYISVHKGETIDHGHYFSFERPSIAQVQEAHQNNLETDPQGDRPKPAKLFNTWTKYEDNKKFPDQTLDGIQRDHGEDTYILQLTPAVAKDVEVLILSKELVDAPLATVTLALSDFEGSVEEAIDQLGDATGEAVLGSLRAAYDQFVQAIPSQQNARLNGQIWMAALARVLNRPSIKTGLLANRLAMFLRVWLSQVWANEAAQRPHDMSLEDFARSVLEAMLSPLIVSRMIFELSSQFAERDEVERADAASQMADRSYDAIEKEQLEQKEKEQKRKEAAQRAKEKEAAEAKAKAENIAARRKKNFKEFNQINKEELAQGASQDPEALQRAEEARLLALGLQESMLQPQPGIGSSGSPDPGPANENDLAKEMNRLSKSVTEQMAELRKLHQKFQALGASPDALSQETQQFGALSQSQSQDMAPPAKPRRHSPKRGPETHTGSGSRHRSASGQTQPPSTPKGDSSMPGSAKRGGDSQSRPTTRHGVTQPTSQGAAPSRSGGSRGGSSTGRGRSASTRSAGPHSVRTGSPTRRSKQASKAPNTRDSSTTPGNRTGSVRPAMHRPPPPFLKMAPATWTIPAPGDTPASELASLARVGLQYAKGETASSETHTQKDQTPSSYDPAAVQVPRTPSSQIPTRPSPRRPRAASDDQPRLSHPSDPSGRQTPYTSTGSPRQTTTAEQGGEPTAGRTRRAGRLQRGLDPRTRRSPDDPFADASDPTAGTSFDGPAEIPEVYSQSEDTSRAPSDQPQAGTLTQWIKKKASSASDTFGSLRRATRGGVGPLPALTRKKSTRGLSGIFAQGEHDTTKPPVGPTQSRREDETRSKAEAADKPGKPYKLAKSRSMQDILSALVPKAKATATTAVQQVPDIQSSRPEVPAPTPAAQVASQSRIAVRARPLSTMTMLHHTSETQADDGEPQADVQEPQTGVEGPQEGVAELPAGVTVSQADPEELQADVEMEDVEGAVLGDGRGPAHEPKK